MKRCFQKALSFYWLALLDLEASDILVSPQVIEHFSDITSLQKEMRFTVPSV